MSLNHFTNGESKIRQQISYYICFQRLDFDDANEATERQTEIRKLAT